MERRVVYTCMYGYSEKFNDFEYEPDGNIDFVCFTDDPELRSRFWKTVLLPRQLIPAPRASRRAKMLPHRFLSQYDCSLYVDNIVRLRMAPRAIFERFLQSSASPLVCFRHPERNCVYDEAELVASIRYDDPVRIDAQMKFYRRLGYPAANGLIASGFLLRRHNDPRVIQLMECWFEQMLCYSFRDQLSFNVSAWLNRFEYAALDLNIADSEITQWPVPQRAIRVPRGFDDERYLELNPDVAKARMDPRKHWLLHGHAEGRSYESPHHWWKRFYRVALRRCTR